MDTKYIFIADRVRISKNLPFFHPKLEGGRSNIIVGAFPYQENVRIVLGQIRIGTPPDKVFLLALFDAANPDHKNLSGLQAYGGGAHPLYTVFADGSRFDAYLPPDAKPVGSEEWRYHMRWERVYENYYAVTIYRGISIVENGLYTEKDGRDLGSALGESSATQPFPWVGGSFATYLGHKIEIHYGFSKRSEIDFLALVEVKEEDLPEDFPKGLVLWLK